MEIRRWNAKIKCQILQQQLRLAHQLKSSIFIISIAIISYDLLAVIIIFLPCIH